MAIRCSTLAALVHRRKFEVEGPPLPPEMAAHRKKMEARRLMGDPGMFLATMVGLSAGLNSPPRRFK